MDHQEHLFTISEFARRAGITVRTLRFYEEVGLLVPSQHNRSGHRLYGLAELARLQLIQSLKFIGYSLQDIKGLLKDETEDPARLETSLGWQHRLLTAKREELDRAIEAVERVRFLISEGKPVTWTVLRSLLYQVEHEQDQMEWAREYLSEDIAQQLFSLSKEQRRQIDLDMLDVLATIKQLVKDGASPQSPEAFDVLVKLTELATKQIENKEAFAEQLEQAQQSMESDVMDFQFPNFFTPEEAAFVEAIGKSMEALYKQHEDNRNEA